MQIPTEYITQFLDDAPSTDANLFVVLEILNRPKRTRDNQPRILARVVHVNTNHAQVMSLFIECQPGDVLRIRHNNTQQRLTDVDDDQVKHARDAAVLERRHLIVTHKSWHLGHVPVSQIQERVMQPCRFHTKGTLQLGRNNMVLISDNKHVSIHVNVADAVLRTMILPLLDKGQEPLVTLSHLAADYVHKTLTIWFDLDSSVLCEARAPPPRHVPESNLIHASFSCVQDLVKSYANFKPDDRIRVSGRVTNVLFLSQTARWWCGGEPTVYRDVCFYLVDQTNGQVRDVHVEISKHLVVLVPSHKLNQVLPFAKPELLWMRNNSLDKHALKEAMQISRGLNALMHPSNLDFMFDVLVLARPWCFELVSLGVMYAGESH